MVKPWSFKHKKLNPIVKVSNSISSHLSKFCLGGDSKSLIVQLTLTSISTVLKIRSNWLVQSDEPIIEQVKIGKIDKKSRTNSFSSPLIPIFKTMNIFDKDMFSNSPSSIVTIELFKKKKVTFWNMKAFSLLLLKLEGLIC